MTPEERAKRIVDNDLEYTTHEYRIKRIADAIREAVEEVVDDYANAIKGAMDEKCDAGTKHCTCVPLLRIKIKQIEAEARKAAFREWEPYMVHLDTCCVMPPTLNPNDCTCGLDDLRKEMNL